MVARALNLPIDEVTYLNHGTNKIAYLVKSMPKKIVRFYRNHRTLGNDNRKQITEAYLYDLAINTNNSL